MPTLIGHLDADCFYASAERVRYPWLQGVPLGVLGNQGACVIAKSYEMKAAGVKTGQPIWEAVKLCPQGVYIKRDFHWYEVLSRRMLEIMQRHSPTVEYYSIDEFFFAADGIDPQQVQQEMLAEVGVPVTVGVSLSRTLAKLASDAGKPFGCCVLTDLPEIATAIETIPITEVTGIGHRSGLKLAAQGIRTCGEFRRADPRDINRLLTRKGEELWWELHGEPLVRIATRRPRHKAMARGGSIGKATAAPDVLRAWLVRNVERLIEALFWHQYVCHVVQLQISQRNGVVHARQTRLPEATHASELLLPAVKQLWKECWSGEEVSRIDVIAHELELAGQQQRSLFVTQPPRIDALKRLVNGKLGRFTLRSAETLPLTEIYEDAAHSYDICDITGKTCF